MLPEIHIWWFASLLVGQFYAENCMKMKEFGPREGARYLWLICRRWGIFPLEMWQIVTRNVAMETSHFTAFWFVSSYLPFRKSLCIKSQGTRWLICFIRGKVEGLSNCFSDGDIKTPPEAPAPHHPSDQILIGWNANQEMKAGRLEENPIDHMIGC